MRAWFEKWAVTLVALALLAATAADWRIRLNAQQQERERLEAVFDAYHKCRPGYIEVGPACLMGYRKP